MLLPSPGRLSASPVVLHSLARPVDVVGCTLPLLQRLVDTAEVLVPVEVGGDELSEVTLRDSSLHRRRTLLRRHSTLLGCPVPTAQVTPCRASLFDRLLQFRVQGPRPGIRPRPLGM